AGGATRAGAPRRPGSSAGRAVDGQLRAPHAALRMARGMTSPPRVSVLTIFLDAERFLGEAIRSVFAQTFDGRALLLVDDRSRDASGDVGRTWAARDPARVRYLAHPGGANRGMSASRNLARRDARGELLAFLDADDVWRPEKLERHVEIADVWPQAG